VPRDGRLDVDYLALIQREMERVTGVAEAAASGGQAR